MDKKEIQKRRMMSYFIEAVNTIIEQDGIENVTVRGVADIAGYNSATLYNYFENLDHLLFFSSMKYLKDYALALPSYTKDSSNVLEKYFNIWRCFCYYSFNNPQIYNRIFFNKYSYCVKDAVKEYYEIFPEELGEQPSDLLPMLLKNNIQERNYSLLEKCSQGGFINLEDVEHINEMTLLIYQGMFSNVMNSQITYSVDEAVERTLRYIKQTVFSFKNN